MQYYLLENQLQQISEEEAKKIQNNIIIILSSADMEQKEGKVLAEETYLLKREKVHFCKAESYSEYIYGTFSIPANIENETYKERKTFSYCIHKYGVLFLDDSQFLLSYIERLENTKTWKKNTIGYFFSIFLEELVKNDLIALEKIQKKLMKLEEEVLENILDKFNHKIIAVRKEILDFYRYYAQLIELGQELQENQAGIFEKEEISLFRLFSERAARLQSETEVLREYSMQVREAYQAQIDIKQNNIMKILTIVTTIFFPLSLLAGWYGMNFDYMPELHWKYGYFVLIGIGLLIIGLCLWIFKKKKFF